MVFCEQDVSERRPGTRMSEGWKYVSVFTPPGIDVLEACNLNIPMLQDSGHISLLADASCVQENSRAFASLTVLDLKEHLLPSLLSPPLRTSFFTSLPLFYAVPGNEPRASCVCCSAVAQTSFCVFEGGRHSPDIRGVPLALVTGAVVGGAPIWCQGANPGLEQGEASSLPTGSLRMLSHLTPRYRDENIQAQGNSTVTSLGCIVRC